MLRIASGWNRQGQNMLKGLNGTDAERVELDELDELLVEQDWKRETENRVERGGIS